MSSKRFTEEQQKKLRQNPYVYNVTPTRLSLTKEFKERFIEACDAGESPRTFLENHGFSTELIGERRFYSIPQHIRAEFRNNGGFREGYGHRISGEHAPERPESTDDELKSLRHEIDYLKQEMEFLKKISSIRNTKR